MSIKAIIPARGGSKGILKKNIVDFAGKPLLAWTIEQAKKASYIDAVYVSSDDDEILEVAKEHGANPIKRPPEISGDKATSESCLLHALQHMNAPSAAVFLQATSPLREPQDIDHAIKKFNKEELDSLFSATPLEDFFIWRVNKAHVMSYNYDYRERKRRQDISGQIVENGSFYIFKPSVLAEHNNRLGGKIGYSLMDSWKLHEIDNLDDLELCEYLFKKKGLDKI
jgi:CMP-N,N'-diacetyllegionaminic acid synthase